MGLTQERLKELFYYHPSSGDFVRLTSVSSNTRPGDHAGCLMPIGYLGIRIDGVLYYTHRLAWLYVHGEWPPKGVDHKDGEGCHNWLDNLRPVGQAENIRNQSRIKVNSTGHKNIRWDSARKKYVVNVKQDYKQIFCGRYDLLDDALIARDAALLNLHGAFARAA